MDHIISLDEDPTLAYEPLNCRVLCNHHNRLRQHHCTAHERAAVLAAIKAHNERMAKHYLSQL